MNKRDWRKVLRDELIEALSVFVVLAPFFISFVTYGMLLSGDWYHAEFEYGIAIFNALVLSKIILIGEAVRLGASSEKRPLILSTIHKAALFTLFYMAFHALETFGRTWFKRHSFSAAAHDSLLQLWPELLGQGLVMFFALMPFFALEEVRRVIGPDQFYYLFLHRRESAVPQQQPGRHAA